MADLVYLRLEAFDPAKTLEIAASFDDINRRLMDKESRDIFVGSRCRPGWGVSDLKGDLRDRR